MKKLCIVLGAAAILFASTTGCGARTTDAGDQGALASCGDNCSPAQVSASCADICQKIAQSGCSSGSNDCMTSCSQLPAMAPSCTSAAYAFLRCLEGMQPTCDSSGEAQFLGGCDSQEQALSNCVGTSTTVTVTNPGGGTGPGTVPDTVCPGIPRPSGGERSCSGFGSAAGSSGTTTCTSSCSDGAGNLWEADCAGSTCTCTFNGIDACTCPMTTSGCASCCPGTN